VVVAPDDPLALGLVDIVEARRSRRSGVGRRRRASRRQAFAKDPDAAARHPDGRVGAVR
jgi:hypothetical protein